jgi:hypothetical protein
LKMNQSASLKKEPTKRTPWILLEPGRIFIMGRSIPENPGDFYRPVLEWIADYVENYTGKTLINLGFEYINTSSTKWIFSMLKELSVIKDIQNNASVKWYYENGDEDMCELGFILRSLVDCPFVVVEVGQMNKEKYEKILAEIT